MTVIGFGMLSVVCFLSLPLWNKQWQLLSIWRETGNLFVCTLDQVPEFTLKYAWTWWWDNEIWSQNSMCSLFTVFVCAHVRGVSMCCVFYLSFFLCVCTTADTQQWPCRCSITPDTAPGGGWRWWFLWCGSSLLPSPALYCLASTTLVTATYDLSSQVAP